MVGAGGSTQKNSGSLIFGAIFMAIGYVVAVYFGKPILDNAKASAEWPRVRGEVVSSRVVQSRDTDKKTKFRADVVYEYAVEGTEFQSDTISFGMESTSSKAAHSVRRRFPKGKDVMVSYDPESPETAVLEPGASWGSYGVLGVGLVFFVAGLLFFGSSLLRWLGLGLSIAGVFGALALRRRKAPADPSSGPSGPSGPSPRSSSGRERPPGSSQSAPGGGQPAGGDDGIDIG